MFFFLKSVILPTLPNSTSLPMNEYSPAVGASNAAIIFNNVVFPEPDGPKSATISPDFIVKSTLSRARTSVSPSP